MKTTVSVFAAFFFYFCVIGFLSGRSGDFNTTFSEIEKVDEHVAHDTALYHGRVMLESAHI